MTTVDFIAQLFCWVDDKLTQRNNNRHTQANLYPFEVVPIALHLKALATEHSIGG